MKLLTVIGARPQFIKASALARAIRRRNLGGRTPLREVLVHTGQHWAPDMSEVFFQELELAEPDYHLGLGGLPHSAMTGRMLEALEQVLDRERPDRVVVYGDTNSTLAGALAARQHHVPVAHVEAGLRSFNPAMAEELNRLLTDHCADLLLCPTEQAVRNLEREGILRGVHRVGDITYDVALHGAGLARARLSLDAWGLEEGRYALCTVHRAETTDEPACLEAILGALREIARDLEVVLPLHPRTRRELERRGRICLLDGLRVLEPLPYLAMTRLELSARAILTDSGGIQKEAFYHRVPCITLRRETEWMETVELGWNTLAGVDRDGILAAWAGCAPGPVVQASPFGDGHAAETILNLLESPPP